MESQNWNGMEFLNSSISFTTISTTIYRTHYLFNRDWIAWICMWCVFTKHEMFCIALHWIVYHIHTHTLCWNRIKIFLEKVTAWKWITEEEGSEGERRKKKTPSTTSVSWAAFCLRVAMLNSLWAGCTFTFTPMHVQKKFILAACYCFVVSSLPLFFFALSIP